MVGNGDRSADLIRAGTRWSFRSGFLSGYCYAALEGIPGHRLAAVAGPQGPPDWHDDRVLHEGDVPVGVEGIRPPGMRAAGGPGALVDEPAVGAGVVVDPQHVVVQRKSEPVAGPVDALAQRRDLGGLRVQG